jgi:hypothetical protein
MGKPIDKLGPLKFHEPMVATLVRKLPEGPEWEYQVKFDGYRLQAIKEGDRVQLYSRRGNDFTKRIRQNRHRRFQGSSRLVRVPARCWRLQKHTASNLNFQMAGLCDFALHYFAQLTRT